jgi:hypothetical protein
VPVDRAGRRAGGGGGDGGGGELIMMSKTMLISSQCPLYWSVYKANHSQPEPHPISASPRAMIRETPPSVNKIGNTVT